MMDEEHLYRGHTGASYRGHYFGNLGDYGQCVVLAEEFGNNAAETFNFLALTGL